MKYGGTTRVRSSAFDLFIRIIYDNYDNNITERAMPYG
jgi:hypothetical protein